MIRMKNLLALPAISILALTLLSAPIASGTYTVNAKPITASYSAGNQPAADPMIPHQYYSKASSGGKITCAKGRCPFNGSGCKCKINKIVPWISKYCCDGGSPDCVTEHTTMEKSQAGYSCSGYYQ